MSQVISEFGDRLNQMALIAMVYSKNPGSAVALAKLMFFTIIPVFLIGPVAGVYVDRWDRQRVMIISDILRGCLVLAIPVFIYFGAVLPVYFVVFFMFSATRFFLPSKMAFIPEIVSEDKILVANSLSGATRVIANVLGFAMAGFIVKLIGHVGGFYLDSVSFFISAIFINSIAQAGRARKIKDDIRETKEKIKLSIRKNVWTEIVEGFGLLFRTEEVRLVALIMFFLMAGAGAVFCVFIVFVQKVFGTITESLGFLGSFLGVGLLAGTFLFGKFGQKSSRVKTVFSCFILCGITLILFAGYSNIYFHVTGSGIIVMFTGIFIAPIFISSNTMLHVLVPDSVRGRIFSAMEVVTHLAFLLMMFMTAYISKHVSEYRILTTCGTMFVLAGGAGLIWGWKKRL